MKCVAAIRKCACFRGGNFLRAHQFFCEDFRRLKLRCRFIRTKCAQFLAREQIDDSRRKRIIRANHCQIHTIFSCEPDESFQISDRDRNIFRDFACPAISGRAKNPVRMRRLPQLPCKRVFAATAANDENLHQESGVTVTVAREIASRRLALLLCS